MRALIGIAWQTAARLCLNMGAAILTSVGLEDWSRSSDIWLRCMTLETYYSKERDNYEAKDVCMFCAAALFYARFFSCLVSFLPCVVYRG